MLIKREDLLEAISVIDLVQTRSGIPSSEFIKIDPTKKGISLSLTSEVIGRVECKTSEDWIRKSSVYVDRRVLIPFLIQSSKVTDVSIDGVGKTIVMKLGRRKLSMAPVEPITGYGDKLSSDNDTIVTLTDGQKEMAACAVKYAPQDQSLTQLQCIYFGKDGSIVSSNSTSIFYGKEKKFPQSIMFPIYLMNAMNDKVKQIRIGKKLSSLVFPNGFLTQTLPTQTVSGFPIEHLTSLVKLKDKHQTVIVIKAKKLHGVLSQFSNVMAATKDKVIKIFGASGKVMIRGSASHASFSDKFSADVSANFSCTWPLDAVLPFIEYAAANDEDISVQFSDGKKPSPYYLSTSNATLVISRKAE